MGQNIFQLWAGNGKLTPFAARRDSWAERTVVIVEQISLGKWPYGEAYGDVHVNGVKQPPLNPNIDRSPSGLPSISCAGSYQWHFVEMPGLARGEPIDRDNVHADCVPATKRKSRRSKKQNSAPLKSGDLIGFGSFRHCTIDEVFRLRPSWLEWAIRNVESFAIDAALVDKLNPTDLSKAISPEAVGMNRNKNKA